MKAAKKRRLKLTREQRKAIWAAPKENAGAGWSSKRENTADPRVLEQGR